MPLFPWALLITAAMLLLTLPILSGALLWSWLIFILIHFSLIQSLEEILYSINTYFGFWTSRSLYLNNSSIWGHKHSNCRSFTKNNLWEPINDLCHELYFSSWKCCLGTSYVFCRFRN